MKLAKGDLEQLKLSMRYIMSKLSSEQEGLVDFKLDDEKFYKELKDIISSREDEIKNTKEKELANMWNMVEVGDECISNYTGYNIK